MNPILTGTLILTQTDLVATDTLRLRFKLADLATLTGETHPQPFDFKAGQFVSIGFTEKAWRAYSIASTTEEAELELVVRMVEGGVGSEAFRAAKAGDSFPFKGPFGHFGLSENPEATLVFCATGTGITPFRSMVKTEATQAQPRPMVLLYGGKNADDLAYLDEVNRWSEKLEVKLGLSRDPDLNIPDGLQCQAENCRITALLPQLDFNQNLEFYLCGNGAMVKSVQETLEEHDVPQERVFMERFNWSIFSVS